jgi:hypothetical protein
LRASTSLSVAKRGPRKAKRGRDKAAEIHRKNPWLTPVVQTKPLTTEDLAVPAVEVVGAPKGKAVYGPWYPDQLEKLRAFLRDMPKREKFVVVEVTTGFWIHRKS